MRQKTGLCLLVFGLAFQFCWSTCILPDINQGLVAKCHSAEGNKISCHSQMVIGSILELNGNNDDNFTPVIPIRLTCTEVGTWIEEPTSYLPENDDLDLKVMSTISEYQQPKVAQVVEKKFKPLDDVFEVRKRVDEFPKEEETKKYMEKIFNNLSKQLQEIQLRQLKDSNTLEKIASSVTAILDTVVKKDHLRDMENKISKEMEETKRGIREMSDKLTERDKKAKKKNDNLFGMIKNVDQKLEENVIPTMAEISYQLSHINESTLSAKSSFDETQELISSVASSFIKEIKEVVAKMDIERKVSATITTVGNNIITAVTKTESEIEDKLSNAALGDINGNKNSIHESYGLHMMSRPSNCAEIQKSGKNVSGIYTVMVSSVPLQVYCDMETDGGGWTVFQRRDDVIHHIDFFRYWADYKGGFGDLDNEFWLGLEAIHALTSRQSMSLRVDLEDFEGVKKFAFYRWFSVGDEGDQYRLYVEDYLRGDGGDSMAYHNKRRFTTRDRDNDEYNGSCAHAYHGAWWYNACGASPNGIYFRGEHKKYGNGVNWHKWRGSRYSLKKTELKIRPLTDF